MTKLLLLPLAFFVLTGCVEQLVPRSPEKAASLQSQLAGWTAPEKVLDRGRARSHQVFETEKLTIKKDLMRYQKGRTGMLAVISEDGYALSAAHVVRKSDENCILASPSEQKRLHLRELRLGRKKEKEVKLARHLQAYPKTDQALGGVDPMAIRTGKIRIVHRFPGRDLVLVKLPQRGGNYFKLGGRPSRGDLLFSSGNSRASQPGASSGVVKRITRRDLALSTMPLAPGDSGGPVMNSEGDLVGIAVQGRLGKFNTLRLLNHSGIELIPTQEILEFIRRDRIQFQKNEQK